MKKIFLSIIVLTMCGFASQAQTVDRLFTKYAKEKGVAQVKIGKAGMFFAGLFEDVKGVTGIDVLSFERCEAELKDKLRRSVKAINDPDYETLMVARNDGDNVRILVKKLDDDISEFVVLAVNSKDVALIRLRGKFSQSDLQKLIND